MKTDTRKILMNKGGSGGYTYRISLPIEWILELGIDEDHREVDLSFDGYKIIIEKKK